MKTSHLPHQDAAIAATLSAEQQLTYFRRMKATTGPIPSYKTSRENLPDLLNVQAGPFDTGGPAPLEHVERDIVRRAPANSVSMNIEIARAVRKFARTHDVRGVRVDIAPVRLGTFQPLVLCLDAVIEVGGDRFLVYVNPRRNRLSPASRLFVHSVLSAMVIDTDPGLFDGVSTAVLEFGKNEDGTCFPLWHRFEGGPLIGPDELDEMMAAVHASWIQVHDEIAGVRRAGLATGTTGSLL